jgi:hypothetical protein
MDSMTTLKKLDDEAQKALETFSKGVLFSISLGFLATKLTRTRIFFHISCGISPLIGLQQAGYNYSPSDFYNKPSNLQERESLQKSLKLLAMIPKCDFMKIERNALTAKKFEKAIETRMKLGF